MQPWAGEVGETEYRDTLLDCGTTRRGADQRTSRGDRAIRRVEHVRQIKAAGFLPSHGFASLRAWAWRSSVRTTPIGGQPRRRRRAAPLVSRTCWCSCRCLIRSATSPISGQRRALHSNRLAYAKPIRSTRALPRPPDGDPDAGDERDPDPRPSLACIPHHEWMIHSEGATSSTAVPYRARRRRHHRPLGRHPRDRAGSSPHPRCGTSPMAQRPGEAAVVSIVNPTRTLPVGRARTTRFLLPHEYD